MDALEEEIKNKNHEALKLRRKWITGVNDLVEKINESFGSMMADLGYNGQVWLNLTLLCLLTQVSIDQKSCLGVPEAG